MKVIVKEGISGLLGSKELLRDRQVPEPLEFSKLNWKRFNTPENWQNFLSAYKEDAFRNYNMFLALPNRDVAESKKRAFSIEVNLQNINLLKEVVQGKGVKLEGAEKIKSFLEFLEHTEYLQTKDEDGAVFYTYTADIGRLRAVINGKYLKIKPNQKDRQYILEMLREIKIEFQTDSNIDKALEGHPKTITGLEKLIAKFENKEGIEFDESEENKLFAILYPIRTHATQDGKYREFHDVYYVSKEYQMYEESRRLGPRHIDIILAKLYS